MSNKTEGVRILVQDVLQSIPEPYEEDIILNVCRKIKDNRDWFRRYEELGDDLTNDVVLNWIGKYTKELTGLKNIRVVKAPKGSIVTSYTKLGR